MKLYANNFFILDNNLVDFDAILVFQTSQVYDEA